MDNKEMEMLGIILPGLLTTDQIIKMSNIERSERERKIRVFNAQVEEMHNAYKKYKNNVEQV
jgi:hypothetical protein